MLLLHFILRVRWYVLYSACATQFVKSVRHLTMALEWQLRRIQPTLREISHIVFLNLQVYLQGSSGNITTTRPFVWIVKLKQMFSYLRFASTNAQKLFGCIKCYWSLFRCNRDVFMWFRHKHKTRLLPCYYDMGLHIEEYSTHVVTWHLCHASYSYISNLSRLYSIHIYKHTHTHTGTYIIKKIHVYSKSKYK